MPRTVLIQQFN